MTGYPSIDKPWLKYYSHEAINTELPKCTIYDYLWECNEQHLSDIALNYFGKRISYRQVFQNIQQTARAFAGFGVKTGDVVTILATNTPETIYTIYALNLIGAVPDLEYVTASEEEIAQNIHSTKAEVVVILDLLIPKFTKCISDKKIILISPKFSLPPLAKTLYSFHAHKVDSPEGAQNFWNFVKRYNGCTSFTKATYDESRTAVMVHSGGTTGTPKIVELTNSNLNAIAFQYQHFGAGYQRKDSFMHCIPPFHAFGLSVGIHMPLSLGFTVYACAKYDEDYVTKHFYEVKPAHFFAGTSHAKAILSSNFGLDSDLNNMKSFAVGGSSLAIEDEIKGNQFLEMHNCKTKILMGYGMSELSATVCAARNDAHKLGSVGIPFPKCNVKVINPDNGIELSYGMQGEICVSSPTVMKSYFENDSETKALTECSDDGTRWIHTGDMGYIDSDGFVFISGRIKRIYTTTSEDGTLFKLFPDYVEATIRKLVEVTDVAVVCIPDEHKKHIAIAYVIHGKITGDEIIEFCENQLPSYAVPQKIYSVDAIPTTPVGKPDYLKLERWAVAEI